MMAHPEITENGSLSIVADENDPSWCRRVYRRKHTPEEIEAIKPDVFADVVICYRENDPHFGVNPEPYCVGTA